MARGGAREASGEARTVPVEAARSSEGGVLQAIVAVLLARLEASPLMRKTPAQCTPEEQASLVELLSSLVEVRATQAALAPLPDLAPSLVEEAWPELAALLAGTTPTRGARRTGGNAPPVAQSVASPNGAAETPGDDAAIAFAATAPVAAASTVPVVGAMTEGPAGAYRDLGDAVLHVLRTDRRPWSASRIAARLQEADPLATRKDVYDTLWHHPDLFRRTGHGWELAAR